MESLRLSTDESDPQARQANVTTSLKAHILLALGITLMLLMLLISSAALFILWPSYQQIEQDDAERNLVRLERAIERSQEELSVLTLDWANWDDTYRFLQGDYPHYLESNMVALTFENAQLSSILLFDSAQQLVWGGSLGTRNQRLMPASDQLVQRMQLQLTKGTQGHGLTSIDDQAYLYAWQPVRDSQAIQPANGYLVMLRPFDSDVLNNLRSQLNLDNLNMRLMSAGSRAASQQSLIRSETARENQLQQPLDGSNQHLLLSFVSDRQITQLANTSLFTGGLLILGAILCSLLVIWWQMQRQISLPLGRLVHSLDHLGDDDQSLRQLDSLARRQDEIGSVTRAVREMHLRILSLSNLDPLTGLPNRRQFDQLLSDSLRNAHSRLPFSLCFIDLDGFKPVNDQYGHETGDHLLQELARRMSELLRGRDTLARIGGDEFVLVLDSVHRPQLVRPILERLQRSIQQVCQIDGHPISISASIGVASFPQDAIDLQGLLQHADIAMYHSKKLGGGRVTFAADVTGSLPEFDGRAGRYIDDRNQAPPASQQP